MAKTDIIDVPASQEAPQKVVGESDSVTGDRTTGARTSGAALKGDWVGSTKLGRLELELREMRQKRPGAKAVVFSQVWSSRP